VNTIQEIEAAIRSLSPEERQRLAEDLPGLVPELDGDAAWEKSRQRVGPLAWWIEADFSEAGLSEIRRGLRRSLVTSRAG
jgi:hypothetical protein